MIAPGSNQERHQRLREIFHEACDLTDDARESYLTKMRAAHPALAGEIDELFELDSALEDHFEPIVLTQWLSEADLEPSPKPESARALPQRLGRYEIIRELGAGGAGVVYEAEQDYPQRRVAIKLLRLGEHEELQKRFEHEARMLAQLHHPGIAQIFDAGRADLSYATGLTIPQQYIAMELIDGVSLRAYAKRENLPVRARLELVARVADAVQYAHEIGVVHRDLKPANIIVDEHGQPKVLDFGVARVTNADTEMTTMQTATGMIIGTLAYMSPEQVTGNARAIDHRADVYALGVILYEMLTEQLPHRVMGMTIPEAARTIQDDEPSRMGSVNRNFRGDIETIAAKALEKDADRRYASAAALAADIRRYLHDEPIVARPPSAVYQLRKFARRHKAIAAGATIAALALVAAAGVSSWYAVSATQARDNARQEAAKAQQINSFLKEILSSAAPDHLPSEEVSAVSLLDRATERMAAGEFGNQPAVLGELQTTVGQGYLALGRYAQAQTQFEAARDALATLPKEAASLARALEGLGAAHQLQNNYEESEACFLEARRVWRENGHPEGVLTGVWPHGLPSVLYYTGRYEESEKEYRAALREARKRFGDRDVKVAQALSGLGTALEALSHPDEAIAVHREAAEIYREAHGSTNVHLANCLNNLGNALQGKGDLDAAAAVHGEALTIRRAILRPNHPEIAMSFGNLSLVLLDLGRYQEAEQMCRESLAIRREVLPPVHHSTAATMSTLAATLQELERYDEALVTYDEAIEMAEQAVPAGHIMPVVFRANRADCLLHAGRPEEAKEILLTCYGELVDAIGVEHRRTRKVARQLASACEALGLVDEAKQWNAAAEE